MATVSTQSWIASITLPTASLYMNLTLGADQDVSCQSNSTFQSWPNISETLVTTISYSSEGTTVTGEYQELGLRLIPLFQVCLDVVARCELPICADCRVG